MNTELVQCTIKTKVFDCLQEKFAPLDRLKAIAFIMFKMLVWNMPLYHQTIRVTKPNTGHGSEI